MFAALQEHYRDYPPVHVMVAAFVGYKPQGQARSLNVTQEQMKAFLADFDAGARGNQP